MKLSYNLRELSHATGLGRTYLYSKISSGELVRIKAGSRTLITAESAEAFIQRLVEAEKGA